MVSDSARGGMQGTVPKSANFEKIKAINICCFFYRHPFTPPKLSAYVDEAKTYAAEHTLQTLGIPTEGAENSATNVPFPGM